MSKYLIKTTEVYRCDTEKEANLLIEAAKSAIEYEVTKSTVENRQSKADISGLTKFLKQQDRQDVQSYHYVGGYIF